MFKNLVSCSKDELIERVKLLEKGKDPKLLDPKHSDISKCSRAELTERVRILEQRLDSEHLKTCKEY
jgi:hypothetical protein